jgi:hypothetical protein
MLGLEHLGGQRLVIVRELVPPSVALLVPRGPGSSETPHDDDVLDAPAISTARSAVAFIGTT